MSGATLPDVPIPQRPMVWVYAGFWWRVLAYILDYVILTLITFPILMVVVAIARVAGFRDSGTGPGQAGSPGEDGPMSHVAYTVVTSDTSHWTPHLIMTWLIFMVVPLLYYGLLESSRWQATLGKRACGLCVTDLSGRRIGLGRAVGRYLGQFVSAALFCIGFLMVGWTRRKQGLHDLMAGTLVMRRREADPVFTFNAP